MTKVKEDLCLTGRIIGPVKRTEFLHWERPGPCDNCGVGPLHGVGNCDCSFRRDRMRLCRRCAISWDLERTPRSPLLSAEDNQAVQRARELLNGPPIVVAREGEHTYEFTVRIHSFGMDNRNQLKNQVTRSLMSALHLKFADRFTVIDRVNRKQIKFDPKAHGIGGVITNGNGNGSHAAG